MWNLCPEGRDRAGNALTRYWEDTAGVLRRIGGRERDDRRDRRQCHECEMWANNAKAHREPRLEEKPTDRVIRGLVSFIPRPTRVT
jgi:hypothetical protein